MCPIAGPVGFVPRSRDFPVPAIPIGGRRPAADGAFGQELIGTSHRADGEPIRSRARLLEFTVAGNRRGAVTSEIPVQGGIPRTLAG
jgi:hypothetical protein